MPEDTKPAHPSTEGKPKMVLESDLIAAKRGAAGREKQLKEELAEARSAAAKVEAELRVAKLDADDDAEVKAVREYLIKQADEVAANRAKLEKDLGSFQEREGEARVQALATQYGVAVELIKEAEDPEKEALKLYAERLAKEKAEAAPESIVETGESVTTKKSVWDMTDEEFDKDVAQKEREALSKK